MANEWYTFESEATAQVALDTINSNSKFPIVGKRDGEPANDKQKTIKWCANITLCEDGKYRFPKIPDDQLDFMEVSEAERQAFLDTFNPTIEEFLQSWFPEPTGEF